MPPEWRTDDPRDHVYKRATIAICVDRCIFGGDVETKHGWSIFFHHNHLERRGIYADDEWPTGWRWVFVPSTAWKEP